MSNGIISNGFIFPCFRTLKQTLGEFDAIVECTELATRRFIDNANSSGNVENYISEQSKRYDVRVDNVDIATMPVRVAQFHIISVYQQAEYFFSK